MGFQIIQETRATEFYCYRPRVKTCIDVCGHWSHDWSRLLHQLIVALFQIMLMTGKFVRFEVFKKFSIEFGVFFLAMTVWATSSLSPLKLSRPMESIVACALGPNSVKDAHCHRHLTLYRMVVRPIRQQSKASSIIVSPLTGSQRPCIFAIKHRSKRRVLFRNILRIEI